ncbi:MAG: 50S ribosomal protein L1 [Thermoproteota archaeon]|nr:MAG: 50S ribosomal protein L1 [Candidatus Korarchaeota archaeon]RLG55552.1 MAG: 50S ribosomal protein L1 [Candidatus Korarchaeota archaeon]
MSPLKLKEKDIKDAIRKALNSPQRNFLESVDMVVVFKGLDLKRDLSARISDVLELPVPRKSKKPKVCVIGTGGVLVRAREANADTVLSKEELEKMKDDKRALKKMAQHHDFFIVSTDVMPIVGRILGPILGPRGKTPIPVRFPQDDVATVVEKMRRSIRLRMRDQPVLQVSIGTKDMSIEDLYKNFQAVVEYLAKKYHNLNQIIKDIYLKTTMGPSVKVGA